jgi:hypothetical protein
MWREAKLARSRNPSHEAMNIDPGLAIVGAALLTILGGIGGAALTYVLGAQQRRDDRAYLEASEKRARIREYELRRIHDTRRQLERVRIATMAVLAGKASLPELDELLEHSDVRVVGDPAAEKAWAEVTTRLVKEAADYLIREGHPMVRLPTDAESNALVSAREGVMRALDAQERRALADEPLIISARPPVMTWTAATPARPTSDATSAPVEGPTA